jgi:hypothetical protein
MSKGILFFSVLCLYLNGTAQSLLNMNDVLFRYLKPEQSDVRRRAHTD